VDFKSSNYKKKKTYNGEEKKGMYLIVGFLPYQILGTMGS